MATRLYDINGRKKKKRRKLKDNIGQCFDGILSMKCFGFAFVLSKRCVRCTDISDISGVGDSSVGASLVSVRVFAGRQLDYVYWRKHISSRNCILKLIDQIHHPIKYLTPNISTPLAICRKTITDQLQSSRSRSKSNNANMHHAMVDAKCY